MKKLNIYNMLILVIAAIALNACGGGGESSSNTPVVKPNTISLLGIVVDGYIKDAKVCLDINSNGICEGTEPTTTTLADGTFSFTNVEVADNLLLPVIVWGGTDIATNKPFKGELKNIVNSATINNSTPIIVTPLTDLIAVSFLQSTTKTQEVLNNSQVEIAQIFNLPSADALADPMKNITVFTKVQYLQQIKGLIETTASKAKGGTLSEAQKLILQNEIKEALVSQIKATADTNLEIDKVLNKIETLSNIVLPNNEKLLVTAQSNAIKNTLSTLSTTISLDKLDALQLGLEMEQELVYTKIKEAVDNTVLEVLASKDATQLINLGATVENTAPTVVVNAGLLTPPTTPRF